MDVKDLLAMTKENAANAGYRIASAQMTNGVRKGILNLLKDKGMGDDKISTVEEVLSSDAGLALISMLLGVGLTYVPHLQDDPRVTKLAEEFRISGMTNAGNFAFETLFQYFMPVISGALSALPEPPAQKVRVQIPEEAEQEEKPAENVLRKNS
jgi:hypothetical protein